MLSIGAFILGVGKQNMSVSEFHLYLLLIHDFHNKHNFSQKPTRFSSGSNCCDKLGGKKVAAFTGTGVFQFGLSMNAHVCPCTHTHSWGCCSDNPHSLPLFSRAYRWRECDAPHLARLPHPIWFIMGNEVHFQATGGDTIIGISKAFSLNSLKLYLFLRELDVISWWTEHQKNEGKWTG